MTLLLGACAGGLWMAAGGQPSFRDLGVLEASRPCATFGMSTDGRTIVGSAQTELFHAYRWTAAGFQVLPSPAGFPSGNANGVSSDGRFVVGYCFNSVGIEWPCVWRDGVVEALPLLPTTYEGMARGVSADGSVVVGSMRGSTFSQSVRWTSTGAQALAGPPGDSEAYGISADGRIIVGWLFFQQSLGVPYRWTAETGMVSLGAPPGFAGGYAYAISADGSTIVGSAGGGSAGHAFRWTQAGGMQDLGVLPGTLGCTARAVSADGSVVVGRSGDETFYWSEATGMRSLRSMLGAALPAG